MMSPANKDKERTMNIVQLNSTKRGRKTKLTPETQQRICKALRAGTYRKTAAATAGIGEKTFYTWLARGETENAGAYHYFVEAVQLAEAEGEAHLLATIHAASKLDWRAASWILERKYPDRWGRRDALAMTGTMEHAGEVNHVVSDVELTPEVQRAAARLTAAYYRSVRGGKSEPPEPEIEPMMLGEVDA